MKLKVFQKGFNYSQDGQGNRLVYHLQGCNMKCRWCSNPEGMPVEGCLFTEPEWLVPSVCPKGAVKEGDVDRSLCAGCTEKECLTAHRNKGIHLSFTEYETEDIVSESLSCVPMFYDGGGVTFTGGEPTMQFEALAEVLRRLKEEGIHTAIESNASNPRLPELFPHISQLIMDCKQCDEIKHRAATGISNVTVLKNLEQACRSHSNVHIRVPMIGGVNDSREDMEAFICFFKSIAGSSVTFEVLTYHEYGREKWARCGRTYEMTGGEVREEDARLFRELIVSAGLSYQST